MNFLSGQKKKWDVDFSLSHNAILLTEVFEKSMGILIKTLVAGQSSNTTSALFAFLSSNFPTLAPHSNNLGELNQWITKVETGLKGMTTKLGNMNSMLDRIFAAVLGGGQANNN